MKDNCVARRLASALSALDRSHANANQLWVNRWYEYIEQIMKTAPSGSGFDNGTVLQRSSSNSKQLVFTTSFHHMDEHGCYDGWTDHKIYARPDFIFGASLTITGANRNGIKDLIHDTFSTWLNEDAPLYPWDNLNADHSQV